MKILKALHFFCFHKIQLEVKLEKIINKTVQVNKCIRDSAFPLARIRDPDRIVRAHRPKLVYCLLMF